MRVYRSVLAALLLACVCAAAAWAQAGYVQIKAENLTDSSGAQISNATACFAPVTSAGSPLAYRVNGAGQAISRPICMPVADGALPGAWIASDPTANGTNLVPDPVIQTGWTTWTNPDSNWSVSVGNGPGGVNALVATSGDSGTFAHSDSAPIAVVPGQTYTFSGWINAQTVTAGSPFWVILNAANSQELPNGEAVAPPGQQGWYRTQFTVPVGVTQVKMAAGVRGATFPAGVGIAWATPLLQAAASQLADTSLTFPQNVCFNFTVTSNQTGSTLIGGSGSGYQCMQPSSASTASSWCSTANGVTTCDVDNYPPATSALGVTTAPQINSVTATTLASGASATASVSGNAGTGYTLNFGIPTGPAGPTGANGQGFDYRGAWAASTAYAAYDIYTYSGTAYVVTTAYSSGASYGSADISNTGVFATAGSAWNGGTVTNAITAPGLTSTAGLTVQGGNSTLASVTTTFSNATGTTYLVFNAPTAVRLKSTADAPVSIGDNTNVWVQFGSASFTLYGSGSLTGVQGTGAKLLTAGTIAANAPVLCTDAGGSATTVGCSSGGGASGTFSSYSSTGSMASTTLVSSVPSNPGQYELTWTASLKTAGVGCSSTGAGVLTYTDNFQDPNASASATNTIATITVATGNGTPGLVKSGVTIITAATATAISHAATYTPPSGCTTAPTWELFWTFTPLH